MTSRRGFRRRLLGTPGLIAVLGALICVSASSVGAAEGRYAAAITALSPAQRAMLVENKDWQPGCPVPMSQLRVLTVRHWDFAGEVRTGQLIVNADVARPLRTVFGRLFELKFPIRHLRLDIYRKGAALPKHGNYSGSFECRQSVPSPCVGGNASGRWSNHAYGHAIDLNPVENPYVGCGTVRDPTRARYIERARLYEGMVTPAVVRAFVSIGWGWGGSWTGDTKDYMHFSTTGG